MGSLSILVFCFMSIRHAIVNIIIQDKLINTTGQLPLITTQHKIICLPPNNLCKKEMELRTW